MRNPKARLYVPKSDVHTNAGFSEAEEFAFMLGEEITVGVPERSEWVQKASWDEAGATLTLTTELGASIACRGVDADGARYFAGAPSKGAWYWAVVVGRGHEGTYPGERAVKFGKAGEPTPVAGKVVRGERKKTASSKRAWFRWW